MKAYVLTKLVASSVLTDRVFPNASVRLDYAKRQWVHSYVRTRMRARNRFEQDQIINSVTLWDDYNIGAEKFAPCDVILDLGAHVGAFTLLCHKLGARHLYAYEPERDNFRLLAQHMQGLNGINLFHLAVFRSDGAGDYTLTHSGYLGDNTGAGTVLMRGRAWDVDRQALIDAPSSTPQPAQTVPLDEILQRFEHVKLLKLDCEGSEIPILMTSRLLARVERVIGEFHEFTPAMYAALDPLAQIVGFPEYRIHQLVTCLERCGFQVAIKQRMAHIGYFDAVRSENSRENERVG